MKPVLLITGASSGLGRQTAVAAADAGYTVVGASRSTGVDVTDDAAVEACVARVVAEHGRLDVLVNNAGIANTFATVETTTMDVFRANIAVNFLGVVAMTRAALPHLRASRGRVVTVGSTRGLIGQPFNEAYSAAKFAVEGFLESLAPVAAEMGVTVTLVEPGPVLGTSFGANAGVTRESLLAEAGPYRAVLETYLDWVRNGGYPGAQQARDVAEVIVKTLADPDPPLRVLTSEWVAGYVARKLADADGTAVRAMARSWLT